MASSPPRLRFAARVVLVFWLGVLAVGLIAAALHATAVLVIAIASSIFFIPSWWLMALLFEEGIGPRSTSARALRWAPWMLISGPIVFVAGVILVLPSTVASTELRMAGAFGVASGVLDVCVAVLALRKKRKERVAAHP